MQQNAPKVTVPELHRLKTAGQKITALTAYDYPFARIVMGRSLSFMTCSAWVENFHQNL